MNPAKRKMSAIVKLHCVKITYRAVLFLTALVIYIYNRVKNTGKIFGGLEENPWVLGGIWLLFFVEMMFRFFPSRLESPGCQKHFAKNFKCKSAERVKLTTAKTTAIAAVSWIIPNTILAILYYLKVFDLGIMYLIVFAYSVCDIICILFFCPFRLWIMKNKCCTTCRIYNWDYAMMFTPMLIVGKPYGLSLFAIAFVLLIVWEVSVYRHPERFTEVTNASLSCANCNEKLCQYKTSILRDMKKGIKENAYFVKLPQKQNVK